MANTPQKPDDDKEDDRDGLSKAMDRLSEGFSKLTKTDKTSRTLAQSDFFRAVKNNDVKAVSKALDSGANPDAYNGSGQTALHIAALNNAVDAARLLIGRGANPLLGKQDDPDHIPLEDAVSFNKPEMVDLLARHGGYVPGAAINGWSLLHRACEKGRARTVEVLLNAGANCNETTENGSTPLLIAVVRGHTEVVKVLLQFQAALETMNEHFVKTDAKKRTAFQLAVDRGQAELIEAMIEKGADVNRKDAEQKTPLLCAIENGNLDLARLLVKAGADLNKPCDTYGTPLVYACAADTLDDKVRAEMIDLLIRLGADADVPSPTGMLPIHLAMTSLYAQEVLAALLRYPVSKDTDGPFGTPLMIATVASSKEKYMQLLLAAGANPNGRSLEDARTPLIQAVIQNNIKGVSLLLQAGANPRLYDGRGKSALSYAREKGLNDIVEILERALTENISQRKPGTSPGL
ncbi:MAG: ankyrin repeat domain-containing protein [Alphaproteobacteria bacterium]|nr:ankyrin repeat domain-containing protein [Alphaproteobacteria bacterium]